MRRLMAKMAPLRRTIWYGVAFALLNGGQLAFGQAASKEPEKPKPAAPAKPEKPAPPNLEEMIARAMKDNPDVRVAEAKLREAEAELNRARLQVTKKVLALHQTRKTQQALIESAEVSFKSAEAALKLRTTQFRAGRVPEDEFEGTKANLEQAKIKLIDAKAKLADIEAEIPYLMGKQPTDVVATNLRVSPVYSLSLTLDDRKDPENTKQPLSASMAEKIRKALNTSVQLKVENTPLPDVLEYLGEKTGVSFHVRGGWGSLKNDTMNLQLGEVPLGAALQAIGDSEPSLQFLVRDYGILVVNVDTGTIPPPGAIRVETLWKAEQTKPKPDQKK